MQESAGEPLETAKTGISSARERAGISPRILDIAKSSRALSLKPSGKSVVQGRSNSIVVDTTYLRQ